MLRPYSSATTAPARSDQKGKNQRKALVILGLPLMVILGLVSPSEFFNGGLRKLAVNCVHNIYALDKQMALDMPNPPAITATLEIPSYISICKEWVQRGAGAEEALYSMEDDSVCMDWTSPHERLLEIISSSILDRVNGKSRYRHDCARTRKFDEAVIGMDRTTIQQMIPVARMDPNVGMVSEADMLAQCKVCLKNFEPEVEKFQFKAYASHQCFGFPQEWEGSTWSSNVAMTVQGNAIVLPEDPVKPNVVPLSTVYKQVRNRLGYIAKIFSNVTDAPPNEHESGVVIFIDPTSKAVAKEVYPPFFPATVTSVTVLASPLCATAYLATGEVCSAYAQDLVEYFKTLYPNLHRTGFQGHNGVQYQMAASSAGSFSRMILAKKLICPPGTPTCLFPGMSKLIDPEAGFDTSATLMECRGSSSSKGCGKATAFFMNVGHGNRVTLEVVDVAADVARMATSASRPLWPKSSNGVNAAAPFVYVMENIWKDEGYHASKLPQPKIVRSVAAAIANADIVAHIGQLGLPSTQQNPNTYIPPLEVPVTVDYINSRAVDELPINLNYGIRETDLRVKDELGLDCDKDLGFAKRALTPAVAKEQSKLRDASRERIEAFVLKAKAVQLADATNGDPIPSMEMEVYCPEITDDGYDVIIDSGTTRITKNDRVIISDGAGTVMFDKDSMTEKTVPMPRNTFNSQNPYTFIYDPVTKKNITIAGKNITINRSDGVISKDPVGILLVDNQTNPYAATLITEGGSGNLRAGDNQKVYSGTVISTGMNRADKGSVIRVGNGYAINDDPVPGQKRVGLLKTRNWWDPFNTRDSPYSTEEVVKSDLGRDIVNGKQPKELTREEQYTYEAPSPDPPSFRRRLMQNDMSRGVAITINKNDYDFGNSYELERICHHNKDKVIAASKDKEALLADAKVTTAFEVDLTEL
jgi:hypothetical protein